MDRSAHVLHGSDMMDETLGDNYPLKSVQPRPRPAPAEQGPGDLPMVVPVTADGRMGAVSLAFDQRDLEAAFLAAYRHDTLPLLRFALYVGCVLFGLLGGLDVLVSGDAVVRLWTIRYAVACPVMLGAALLTHAPRAEHISQALA